MHHIHGFVGPDGSREGQCVLTEGHYFELAKYRHLPANKALLDILRGQGELLIIGMSLSDPNLRRLLYERSKSDLDMKEIYAVLKEEEETVTAYQEVHWNSRRVKLIWIQDYEQIEDLLRQIKFGAYREGTAPAWMGHSVSWLKLQGVSDLFFTDEWQKRTHNVLVSLKEQIVRLFPHGYGEDVELAFLAPMAPGGAPVELRLIARTQKDALSGVAAQEQSRTFRFTLAYRQEQGCSGIAFRTGLPDEAIDNTRLAHRNIPAETTSQWYSDRGFQDWRSILSIPVTDSEDWLPVGIVSITSSFARPF